jgi:hypothetical protein
MSAVKPVVTTSGDAQVCPYFDGGTQTPSDVTTNVDAIPVDENFFDAFADEDGLYLFQIDGSIRVVKQGETEQTELVPAQVAVGSALLFNGAFAVGDTLFWSAYQGSDPTTTKVLSVSKLDGQVQQIAHLDDDEYRLVSVLQGATIVKNDYDEVFAIDDQGTRRQLDQIQGNTGYLGLVGDELYYSTWQAHGVKLFSATLPDGASSQRAALEGSFSYDFLVNEKYGLWRTTEVIRAPATEVDRFVLVDLASGCVTELPGVDSSVNDPRLDAHHVYWSSYNRLHEGQGPYAARAMDLLRVNLDTGVLERLVAPDYALTDSDVFVAESNTTIYLNRRDEGVILAITKP